MNAYDIGVKLALDEVGLTKTAIDDSTIAALVGAVPGIGAMASPITSGQMAPSGKGWEAAGKNVLLSALLGLGGAGLGAVGGPGGMLAGSALGSGLGAGLGHHWATGD